MVSARWPAVADGGEGSVKGVGGVIGGFGGFCCGGTAMTAELGTILGLSTFVFLSVVGVAWRMGRVEGRLTGVERSVERLQADIDGLREDVKAIMLRLPAKPQ